MWVAFANAKATHIFSAKILAYMPYLMIKVLTICLLTTSLVLNNWALMFLLFLDENICCWYSLEAPCMFLWRIKKNTMWIPHLVWSCSPYTSALELMLLTFLLIGIQSEEQRRWPLLCSQEVQREISWWIWSVCQTLLPLYLLIMRISYGIGQNFILDHGFCETDWSWTNSWQAEAIFILISLPGITQISI